MKRRTVLTGLGAGVAALAGCPSASNGTAIETPTPDLSADCPTTQDLDIEWPTDIDANAVETFIEEYEATYYRQKVVDYNPDSRLCSYELGGKVSEGPTEVDEGWQAMYSGGGAIYRPTLAIGATVSDPPEDAEIVSESAFEDGLIRGTLQEAAEQGEADTVIDAPGAEVDEYLDRFASASRDFEELSERGDSDTLYVDIEGTTVKLDVLVTNFHGDYWWDAKYYVDEHVVRRTSDPETDPRNGTLLECRRI